MRDGALGVSRAFVEMTADRVEAMRLGDARIRIERREGEHFFFAEGRYPSLEA